MRILYETHSHTPLCHHAEGDPIDYAKVAFEKGFAGIYTTCHAPLPHDYTQSMRMSAADLPTYFKLVDQAREAYHDQLEVRLGLECDYFPGLEPYMRELLKQADFHFALGSVHCYLPEYRKQYERGSWFDFQKIYYEHLAQAAESGLYDSLAHPDLVKNERPEEWQTDRLLECIENSLGRIARTGVAMELNTSGLLKPAKEMNPGGFLLKEMKKHNIPVTLGADAHRPDRVGDHFKEALEQLKGIGFQTINIYHHRKPIKLLITSALESLHEYQA